MTEALVLTCASCGTKNPTGARFCNGCGAALEAVAEPAAETRKVVTILFCDLVGSTALGEQLDPETLRGQLTRSFDTVRSVVERHGGVLEKFIGDAAMAVFGIPRLHEDDALRAVRAGAEIRTALAPGASGEAHLAWRTGIATGEVVAGDGGSGQRMVTGDAVNVAARLQQAAQPGEILIAAETQRLVRDAVEVESLGELTVKGRQAPIEAFRLVAVDQAAAGHERRLDSPMVGRERQQQLLADAFAEVRDQRICHLFTILGAAGVGKSRLVNEFIASLGAGARVVRGRCLSYGEGITYWPIAEIVRDAVGDADLARVEAVLGDHPEAARIATLIGQAIGLASGDPSADETPWAIRTFVEALSRDQPVVVVLDDLHWGQPLLLDLVEHIADWSHDAPILLVVSARQELLDLRPTWGGGKRFATTISLDPLSAAETGELVENLLGRAELPATVFDAIRAAAEGNPLFVEELLEMLIDEGALEREAGGWAARGDLSQMAIPPSIHALLAARLDGLESSDRAVLERGSVEGTLFHRDAVAELAPEALRAGVGSTLMRLTRREFVAPDRAELVGREAYRFRHQLIRDAAYQAIAKHSRAELHERFAEWLVAALGDRLAEYRPIVAYHLEQAAHYRRELDPTDARLAELTPRAAAFLRDAGIAAQLQADHLAAENFLRRALDLVPAESADALRLRLGLADSLAETGRDVGAANAFLIETRELAEHLGDPVAAARAEVARLRVSGWIGAEEMIELSRRAQDLRRTLEGLGDHEGAVLAGERQVLMLFWNGQAEAALDMARSLLPSAAGYPIEQELWKWTAGAAYYGPTPVAEALEIGEEAAAHVSRGLARLMRLRHPGALLPMLGRFDEGRELLLEEQRIMRELGLRGELIASQTDLAELELMAGRPEEALALAATSTEALIVQGNQAVASTHATVAARASFEVGDDASAIRWAEFAIRESTADDFASQGPGRAVLALVRSRAGDHAEAERLAREAAAIMDVSDYLTWVAHAHADLAEVLLAAGNKAEAAVEFGAALDRYARKGHLVGVGRMEARLAEFGAETAD